MTTKIILEFPYSEKWKWGYLNTNKENRKTLILYNNPNDKTSTQYARYLISVSIGRFLTANEHVDHIDDDKTNNTLNNLQILSQAENNRKSNCIPKIKCICPMCSKKFDSTKRELYNKTNKTKCCSIKCGAKYRRVKNKTRV